MKVLDLRSLGSLRSAEKKKKKKEKKYMAAGDQLFLCGVCAQAVVDDDKAVFCDGCELWHHIACIGLDNHAYEVLQGESDATRSVLPANLY